MDSLSLIVPVHNGAKFIRLSIEKYYEAFSKRFSEFEMIIVCNACTDNTEQICNSLKIPLKVVNASKKGKGNALMKGFEYAQHEIVGFMDADDPFELEEVIKMIEYLGSYDLAIVSKFKTALKYRTSISRRLLSLGGRTMFRFLFGLKFNDTQAGAKFMKKKLLNLFKKDLICGGFEIDMELLYRASRFNARIKEYYIPPKETDFSTVKARLLPGLIYRLLKLRLLK